MPHEGAEAVRILSMWPEQSLSQRPQSDATPAQSPADRLRVSLSPDNDALSLLARKCALRRQPNRGERGRNEEASQAMHAHLSSTLRNLKKISNILTSETSSP